MEPMIIVHVGAGAKISKGDCAKRAGKAGFDILNNGGEAIDAVERAITVMEDEDGHNAGTGAKIRLDGSIQMDAALMDSKGRMGAVACIMDVKNPIQVARKVADTPFRVLAGEGAINFARKHGFKEYDPKTQSAIKRLEDVKSRLKSGNLPKYAEEWREYGREFVETVGAVAVDSHGVFATGSSTGGTSLSLNGRVGDTPLIGCGFYAGNEGSVTVTGIGEYIINKMLSKWVYDRIEDGKSAQKAAELGVALFEDYIPTGVIAISRKDSGVACNSKMAYWSSVESGNSERPRPLNH
jgi:L-asparaginase/beta-aspartyl-peptidase (threonine type)